MFLRLPRTKSAIPGIVKAATWTVAQHAHATYSEGDNRGYSVHRPYELPFVCDCSAGVTCLYCWAGAPDPNGLNYGEIGYTGTLVNRGKPVRASRARAADVVIFGPTTGWHAALVMAGGPDPIVWSMGEQGDPRLYSASTVEQAVSYVNHVESCQVRYFRYSTSLRG
jgi:hypothetical protein